MAKTLVLHPRYDEDTQRIWTAATGMSWNVERRGYHDQPAPFDALYGGYIWGAEIAVPAGIRLDSPPADYLWRLPFDLVKRSAHGVLGKALSHFQFPQFVKAEDRSITSRVYQSVDDLPPNISDDALYTIQEPVVWSREYRCFIVGDEILTASGYAADGGQEWRGDPFNAVAWLGDVLREAREALPHAIVLDIGWIAGRGWAIIEANAAWCSGLYDCDPEMALLAIEAACT